MDNAGMSRGYLIHPSGSLIYHGRAWRYRDTLWRPFRDQVSAWLAQWQPAPGHLVLIGPSAGYTLNRSFLGGFQRISVLEPDWLARLLLRRRFPDIPFEFHPALETPKTLLDSFPEAAYLFCNLLGQTWTDAEPSHWRPAIEASLAGQVWASYHDVVSTSRQPDSSGGLDLTGIEPMENVLAHFWRHGELIVDDHGTYGLFADLPRRYSLWQLTPRRFHLIEWLQG
jgi:hypothetical protein